MAAPAGNRNAAKQGESRLMQVRLSDPAHFDFIQEALSPAERGAALLQAAQEVGSAAMEIVAECARCGDPIGGAEGHYERDGEILCHSCEMIARAATE